MIEAAVITPLLLLLTFGIVEFGALFYVYLSLQNGVSQASRFGVTGNTMPSMSREASVRQALIDATPTITIPAGNITFANMPVGGSSWTNGSLGAEGAIGKVTVTYTWTLLTPLVRVFFTGGQITISAEATMTSERRFL
jgi:Flp pilus assembly protein TadG